jgi:hypothetical protein
MEFVLSAAPRRLLLIDSSNATLVQQLAYSLVLGSAARTALSGAPANDFACIRSNACSLKCVQAQLDAVPQKKEKKRGNDEVGSNTLLASETNIRRVSSDTTNWLHGSVGADLLLCF